MSSKLFSLLLAVTSCGFAQYPAPVVSLTSQNLPKGGYWALEPDPNVDPSGQKRHGRLYAARPPQELGFLNEGLPVMVDWPSLSYLHDNTGTLDPTNIHRPRILYHNYALSIAIGASPPVLYADSANLTTSNVYSFGDTFDVQNAGSYTAIFGTYIGLDPPPNGFALNSASNLAWNVPSQ